MGKAYYNEFDPGAAAWLRELIKEGRIARGDVDERSITEVTASDLAGYTQCHFFAGIGGWSYALRLAGVADSTPVWTGSPPCQPFSVAGKQLGQLDDRHLAPTFMRLVAQCKPAVLFGEQVAAAIGKHWLDDLFIELERQGYACGAAVLPACSVGAPHKRDRLFFGARLAESMRSERNSERLHGLGKGDQAQGGGATAELTGRGDIVVMGNTNGSGSQIGRDQPGELIIPQGREASQRPGGLPSLSCRLADAESQGQSHGGSGSALTELTKDGGESGAARADSLDNFWSDADWLGCRDGKWRPVEPGTFPLVDGLSENLDSLRTIETHVIEEVSNYANLCKTDTRQMLSALRENIQQEASGEAQRFGVLFELYAPEVLLSFLLCIGAAFESITFVGGIQKANDAPCWAFLRELRLFGKSGDPSRRWEPNEFGNDKLADPLFALSLLLARYVTPYWKAAIKAHASAGRVAMLRGAGNAIVPQVAAEFIKAFKGAIEDES